MRTETDYWLEHIPLEEALAYVEGDMKTIRKDGAFGMSRHPFDSYQNLWRYSPQEKRITSVTRLNRGSRDGTFFIASPQIAKQLGQGELSYTDLDKMHEPDVVRVDIERFPSGTIMMTYLDLHTNKEASSGKGVEDAFPWLSSRWYANTYYGYSGARTEEDEKELSGLSQYYWQAVMLKYFTSDLDYDLQKDIMPMATAKLGFDQKVDLLRGEFMTYKQQGLHGSLMQELLPQ